MAFNLPFFFRRKSHFAMIKYMGKLLVVVDIWKNYSCQIVDNRILGAKEHMLNPCYKANLIIGAES